MTMAVFTVLFGRLMNVLDRRRPIRLSLSVL
jgi:hypothetical protein